MQLATFYQDVAAELRRGSSVDLSIPRWTRAAVNFLEDGHAFAHMQKFATLTVNPAAENTQIIAFPNSRIRSWRYIRSKDSYGDYSYLQGISPEDQVGERTGKPVGFWHDGVSKLWLDSIPDIAYSYQAAWYEFTDWPASAEAEPVWLDRGYNVLFAETMLVASRGLRDANLAAIWAPARDEAVKVKLAAEEELKYGGTSSVMRFGNAGL
jgi:hypothetical protein